MAKKAATKKKSGSSRSENITVKVVMQAPEEIGSYYVNYAEVGQSKHDFFVLFGKLPVKPSPSDLATAKETGELHVNATVHLTLPPTLIPGLINALTVQKEKYEKEAGPIRDDSPKALEALSHDRKLKTTH